MHRAVFGQADAYPAEVQQAVDEEVDRLVGQRRIAHGRADALELLLQQGGYGQVFVGGISPGGAAHVEVHALCGGFGQAVGQGLYQQLPVGIVAAGSFRLSLHGGGKDTYRVCDA